MVNNEKLCLAKSNSLFFFSKLTFVVYWLIGITSYLKIFNFLSDLWQVTSCSRSAYRLIHSTNNLLYYWIELHSQ